MRSSWSAERILAALAAASLEAAGLTLAYLAVDWLSGVRAIHFGIASFAAAVVVGLLLARRLRRWSWERYLVAVPATAVLVGAIGAWLAEVSAGAPADPLALLRNGGTWLLGVGVLRGTAHAELDDEGYTVERWLRIGVPALVVFWIVGAAAGLAEDPTYAAAAFGATLTLVSSALLALGLARLAELEVESIDRVARRRWLVLLIGVSGALILVGIPLAGLLQVPVATAVAGALGPLAPFIVVAFSVAAMPLLLLASALREMIGPIDFHVDIPAIRTAGSDGSPAQVDVLTIVALVLGVIATIDVLVIVIVIAAVLRRRRRRPRPPGEEVREGESLTLGSVLRLPRIRLRRPWRPAPANAVEAYRLALGALAGRDEGRRPGETPREHAARVRDGVVGPSVARLAADYQLDALAGRRLTEAEERRAKARWQRIRHWAR